MQRSEVGVASLCLAALLCGCSASSSPSPTPAAQAVAPLRTDATIQDLMDAEVDASADPLWAAVGSVTTRKGLEARQPHTDAQWQELRRHAIILVEATNLLQVHGRKAVTTEFQSLAPGVLSSAEIQQHIDANRDEFDGFAQALGVVARQALGAIDRKDPQALLATGETMDAVCEACHIANWYPHEVIPALPKFAAH